MSYVQIALIPVPEGNREQYLEHARTMSAIFREHGARIVSENWGIDLPDGQQTDFRKAVAATADETVVVAMMHWASKEQSDTARQAMRADPRMADFKPPFDGRRLVFGGFESLSLDDDA